MTQKAYLFVRASLILRGISCCLGKNHHVAGNMNRFEKALNKDIMHTCLSVPTSTSLLDDFLLGLTSLIVGMFGDEVGDSSPLSPLPSLGDSPMSLSSLLRMVRLGWG